MTDKEAEDVWAYLKHFGTQSSRGERSSPLGRILLWNSSRNSRCQVLNAAMGTVRRKHEGLGNGHQIDISASLRFHDD